MKSSDKTYQLACFLTPQLSYPKGLDQLVKKIRQMIIGQGGVISKETSLDNILKKRLAYLIEKHQEAFYLNFDFTLPAKALNQLNQELNSENDIIRHLINIKKKEFVQPEKSASLDRKSETVREFGSAMVDKIEPISKDKPEKKEKLEIKELDKKLEEILNQ
jgi:ribosomal protein S6|tara:strand:- start:453 stop:938 length:486 start_codon:yes stop_codon:yes gene_type:complete